MKLSHLHATIALALALAVPSGAFAGSAPSDPPSAGAKTVDMLIVRPFSSIGSLISTAFFIGTLPITFPAGVADEAGYVLIVAPWRFTGARDLGVYGEYADGRTVTGRLIE